MESFYSKIDSQQLNCPYCGKEFDSQKDYSYHIRFYCNYNLMLLPIRIILNCFS